MSKKKIEFGRDSRCPICHKWFRSDQCPHSFDYVMSVVQAANSNFIEDVKKLKAHKK